MCDCCKKTIVKTDKAPKAIGPYSVGAIGGQLVYTAGQIGLDPVSGEVVSGGIEAETRQALNNLSEILAAAGSGIDKVIKTTVFLHDMADFAAMNGVYAQFFTENAPARTTVAVAGLPKNVLVEIEAVAVVPCKD
jgi:2-iminobutanoate/2-iminopropanoate deaminase